MHDHIEKYIELNTSITRVWQALTDYREFGQWFRVALTAPFEEGKKTQGNITYSGAEHLKMTVTVDKIIPYSYFSFKWHPYAINPDYDYSHENQT